MDHFQGLALLPDDRSLQTFPRRKSSTPPATYLLGSHAPATTKATHLASFLGNYESYIFVRFKFRQFFWRHASFYKWTLQWSLQCWKKYISEISLYGWQMNSQILLSFKKTVWATPSCKVQVTQLTITNLYSWLIRRTFSSLSTLTQLHLLKVLHPRSTSTFSSAVYFRPIIIFYMLTAVRV